LVRLQCQLGVSSTIYLNDQIINSHLDIYSETIPRTLPMTTYLYVYTSVFPNSNKAPQTLKQHNSRLTLYQGYRDSSRPTSFHPPSHGNSLFENSYQLARIYSYLAYLSICRPAVNLIHPSPSLHLARKNPRQSRLGTKHLIQAFPAMSDIHVYSF
jgi:hypothetical protein